MQPMVNAVYGATAFTKKQRFSNASAICNLSTLFDSASYNHAISTSDRKYLNKKFISMCIFPLVFIFDI